MNNKNKISDLVYMAMYLALFMVFDWLANQIGLFKMPNGGTLGLGVIPLIIASYHLGWKKGLAVAILSVVLQFMTGKVYVVQNSDGFTAFQVFIQFMMEYPVAFGVYGLSSLFPNFKNFYSGIVVTFLEFMNFFKFLSINCVVSINIFLLISSRLDLPYNDM